MLINDSHDVYFYLDAQGNVVEGGRVAPAGAATLLVAPGGNLDDASAKRHGLVGVLKSSAEVKLTNPVTGEPIELVDGKAYATRRVPGTPPANRVAPVPAVPPVAPTSVPSPAVVPAQPVAGPAVAGKHISGPEATKSVSGPGVPEAKPDARR